MESQRYWAVTLQIPGGEERVYAVAYPRKPTKDLAAGLLRPQLGMPLRLPRQYRCHEEASLRALEAAGFRLLGVAPD